MLCACPTPHLLAASKVIHEKNRKRLDVLEHFLLSSISSSHSGTPCTNGHCVILRRRHFSLSFRFLLTHATGFSVLTHSYSHFLSVAGYSVVITVNCDEEVGEDEGT